MSSSTRNRFLRLTVAAAAMAALALPAGAGAQGAIQGKKGPAGNAFYYPSAKLIKGEPGTVIWQREVKYTANGRVALPAASKTLLVLYRSRDPKGRPVAVSGTVDLPKTAAPDGGWKMISWGHGTTGVADKCAPSRTRAGGPADGYIQYASATADGWLKAGYAVLRTDYEGLGTDGGHRYLIGRSEGRSIVDMALAARNLTAPGTLSDEYVIGGHSQGGQSALFAAAEAAKDAPGLDLRGVFAYAPASHIYEQRVAIDNLGLDFGGLTGLAVMILDSAAREAGVKTRTLVNPKVAKLLPLLEKGCSPEIGKAFQKIAPKEILKPGVKSDKIDAVLKAMNPAVSIPVPVLILQGTSDSTVFPNFTTALKGELEAKGNNLTFREFAGLTHSTIVTDQAPQEAVLEFLRTRFAG
ncbi:MAG: lipase family protein [Solirubrobacterales bacterium]